MSEPPRKLTAVYVATVATVNGPWVLTLLLGLAGFAAPGWVGAVVGVGLAVGALVIARSRDWAGELVALAGATLLGAAMLPPLVATKVVDAVMVATDTVPALALAEVPETNMSVVIVEDAEVQMARLGRVIAPRDNVRKDRYEQAFDDYAAPLAAAGEDGPAAVWLICSAHWGRPPEETERLCLAKLRERPVVGRIHRAEIGSTMTEPQAIAVARRDHGVETPPEVIYLETTADLGGWARMFLAIGAAMALAITVVGLVGVRWLAPRPA